MVHSRKEGLVYSGLTASIPGGDEAGGAGHTPGPWAWMGGPHGLYLATTHSGRRYVMGFRRMGFNHAQPVFCQKDRMVPAADLVEFEVGDQSVRGFDNAKANDSVYRYDVSGIDNANARLIAAAPELLEALREARDALHQHYVDWDGEPEDAVPLQLARAKCEAAISKAVGDVKRDADPIQSVGAR